MKARANPIVLSFMAFLLSEVWVEEDRTVGDVNAILPPPKIPLSTPLGACATANAMASLFPSFGKMRTEVPARGGTEWRVEYGPIGVMALATGLAAGMSDCRLVAKSRRKPVVDAPFRKKLLMGLGT